MPWTRVRVAACVALVAGVAVLVWGATHTIREIASHGFSPSCADGHPEYDARFCELAGGPSAVHIGAAVLVVAVAAVALRVARRRTARVSA